MAMNYFSTLSSPFEQQRLTLGLDAQPDPALDYELQQVMARSAPLRAQAPQMQIGVQANDIGSGLALGLGQGLTNAMARRDYNRMQNDYQRAAAAEKAYQLREAAAKASQERQRIELGNQALPTEALRTLNTATGGEVMKRYGTGAADNEVSVAKILPEAQAKTQAAQQGLVSNQQFFNERVPALYQDGIPIPSAVNTYQQVFGTMPVNPQDYEAKEVATEGNRIQNATNNYNLGVLPQKTQQELTKGQQTIEANSYENMQKAVKAKYADTVAQLDIELNQLNNYGKKQDLQEKSTQKQMLQQFADNGMLFSQNKEDQARVQAALAAVGMKWNSPFSDMQTVKLGDGKVALMDPNTKQIGLLDENGNVKEWTSVGGAGSMTVEQINKQRKKLKGG